MTFISSPNLFEQLRREHSTTEKILDIITLMKEMKSILEIIYYADRSTFFENLPLVEQ